MEEKWTDRKWSRNIFVEMGTENSPNLVKDINLQIQKTQQTPSRIHTKRTIPNHVIIHQPKSEDKEEILKPLEKTDILLRDMSGGWLLIRDKGGQKTEER